MLSFREFIQEDFDIDKHVNAFKAAKDDAGFSSAMDNLHKEKPTVSHLRAIVGGVSGMSRKQGKRDEMLRALQATHNDKLRTARRTEIASRIMPM